LDLDETLIYASERPLATDHDFRCGTCFIHKRPFVHEFLDICARAYDLGVWTSATMDYAQCIQLVLFDGFPLAFLWARDRCIQRYDVESREYYWVKDLKKVKRAGFELDRVLMVDDTRRNLERNYGNLVVVSKFAGDPADRELMHLADYLGELAGEEDLRRIEKRGWRQTK
jgi:RNA polymerase II subunit A small phosphatase-like protein